MKHFIQQEGMPYPIMIHGVGSSFRGRGLLKVLQLLQQLVAEALLKYREAIDSYWEELFQNIASTDVLLELRVPNGSLYNKQ